MSKARNGWRKRPVCYQDFPASLLPEALADGNPLELWRRKNGELVRG